jgi:hypothetical protein
MTKFAKDAILLFLALRAGDLVNLAAGVWFIPKYVSQNEIGAVLPVSSFATFVSLPLFALAMTVMKETAILSAAGEQGKIKTLLRGVFVSASAAILLVTAATAIAMPKFMRLMRIDDAGAGFLVIVAALLMIDCIWLHVKCSRAEEGLSATEQKVAELAARQKAVESVVEKHHGAIVPSSEPEQSFTDQAKETYNKLKSAAAKGYQAAKEEYNKK